MSSPRGLTAVALPDLRSLLRHVRTQQLPVPITRAGLQSVNLGHLAGRLGCLDGLDRSGVLAALSVAVAERENVDSSAVELVWTGPETRASTCRDTAVVVRQLFAAAERSVLVAGYAFDHGKEILQPLHAAMAERGVRVDLFLDLRARAPQGVPVEAFAAERIAAFLAQNWPFGDPTPRLYYAPETLASDARASVHAKCVVVDERTTLITSANFTDRGQSRNIETGVLIHDEQLAMQLVGQWKRVLAEGVFRPHRPLDSDR